MFSKLIKLSILFVLLLAGYNTASASFTISRPSTNNIGLVGYWTFDGADTNWTTNTTADKSTSGNTGTMTNMSTTSSPAIGRIGQGLNFDGVNDYVNVGNRSSVNFGAGAFSISLWFKPTVGNQLGVLIAKGTASESGYFLILENRYNSNQNTVGFSVNSINDNGHYAERVPVSASYTVGQWNHVVGVWDKSNNLIRIYMNGVEASTSVTQNNGTESQIGNTNIAKNLLIGAYNLGNATFFKGSIDEVSVYNRALSAQEILQQYQTNQPLGSVSSSGGTASSTASACLDLTSSLSSQLSSIPQDPSLGTPEKTYYAINRDNVGRINSQACGAEGINIVASK